VKILREEPLPQTPASSAPDATATVRRSILTVAAALVMAATLAVPAATAAQPRRFTADWVRFEGHRLYARDYPGRGPAFVLMHGFPDNLHLYDRLIPHLRGRRTIGFDFLGWGRSDKPRGHVYTFAEQEAELDAVVRHLRLDPVVPVVHDASGPAGINWALGHRTRVAALALLNTFYSVMPTTNAPEAICIYSDPVFRHLAEAIATNRLVNRWLYFWQVGRFMSNPKVRAQMLRKLWPQFLRSLPAFASLNRDRIPAVAADTAREPELCSFDRPVRIIFGARDPYLNRGIAERFHELLPTSDLFLLPARHDVQVGSPALVGRLLRSIAMRASSST
jgi:pimeloyl-ACP methyl ester carboxylesterase